MTQHDVVIVGTRCAGAPLAMLLARAGLNVLAVDRATFPSDTISTHFLWPRTSSYLRQWGLLDALAATGCPPIVQVTADYGPVAIVGRPSAVQGTDAMYSPRRTVLDELLVRAAQKSGAQMRQGTLFREIIWDADRAVGVQLQDQTGARVLAHAKVVVGADGLWSQLARAVGATTDIEHPSLTCGYYAYWSGVPTEGVEFYVRQGKDILVFPTHDGLTCIWAGQSHAQWDSYRADVDATYHDIVSAAPDLARRLATAQRVTAFKGTSKLPNFYRQSAGKGWALVGDAAYHRDPLVGMGIGDAFLGAQLLADALISGLRTDAGQLDSALQAYQQAFRQKTMPVFEYTLKAAGLKDMAASVPFYEKVARSSAESISFLDVLAGNTEFKAYFNPATMARVLKGAAQPAALE